MAGDDHTTNAHQGHSPGILAGTPSVTRLSRLSFFPRRGRIDKAQENEASCAAPWQAQRSTHQPSNTLTQIQAQEWGAFVSKQNTQAGFASTHLPTMLPRTLAKAVIAVFCALLSVLPIQAQNVDSLTGKKIVFLGDSITQAGAYITDFSYFLEKLYPQKDFDIYGLGLSSETLSGLSEPNHAGGAFPRPCLFERLGRLFERLKPDVIIACYGMNDGIYLPLDPERFAAFKSGVNKLIDQSKAAGVKDLFLVTPPIFDLTPKEGEFNYDTVLAEYAAWEMTLKIPGVHVIDLHTPMRQARAARATVFSKDHVHPGDEGHLLMAKTILAAFGVQALGDTVDQLKADPLYKAVAEKRQLVSSRWMQHIGYTREKLVPPQELGNTADDAARLQEKIDALRRK